ncbi:peptidoglycan-binding domain-containing protein [Streptomyces zaomyceticus]|uniref:peptidoglycan-binding domain-containing protein n=1 Tax=Streptomyces zaomyceticus TaxID=68286 RepID=UPI003420A2EE
MRSKAALTTAVTSIAHEPARTDDRGSRVFGKVAEPGGGAGAGARGQDIELFDDVVRPPAGPTSAARSAHGSRRRRHRPTTPPARRPLSLPLMVAGTLSAGLGAALTVWIAAEPGSGPPSVPSLTLPVAVAPDRVPDGNAVGAPPGTDGSAARSSPRATHSTRPPVTPTPAPTPTLSATAAVTVAPSPRHSSPSTPSAVATSTRPPASHRPGRTPPPEPRDLALGSTGPAVADLQRRLQRLSLYLGSADGVFNRSVEEALTRYQGARNIQGEYGVYGPLTRALLRSETD